MAGPLSYYQQRFAQVANTPNPLEGLFSAVGSGLTGYMQGVEDKRLREERERAKQKEELAAAADLMKAQRAGGLNEAAANTFNNQYRGLLSKLYPNLQTPELQGGRRNLTVGDIMGDAPPALTVNDAGRPQMRDFNDTRTLGVLDAVSGYKPTPPKLEEVDRTKDLYELDATGKWVLKRKGEAKPQKPTYKQGANGNLWAMNADGTGTDTGIPFYQAPVFLGGGMAVGNPSTGTVNATGYTPPMTETDKARIGQGNERLELERIKTKAQALKFRTMAEARFRNEFTDDEGNFNKEAFDEAMARVDSNLAALNLDGGAEAKKAAALKQKQQKARQAANGDVSRVLGGELAVASELFPSEVAQLTDYYQRRQMGETPGRAPVSTERIRQMREGVKQYLRGGKKPAKQAAAPAAKPSPKASAAAILKKYQQNPSAYEVEAGDDD